jgi:hypothetical protein
MANEWKLRFTNARSGLGVGERTFDSEDSFAAGVREALGDIWNSGFSATRADGTELNEAQLRMQYGHLSS